MFKLIELNHNVVPTADQEFSRPLPRAALRQPCALFSWLSTNYKLTLAILPILFTFSVDVLANELPEGKFTSKYGYIDHTGHFAIKPEYDEASNFEEGIAFVRKESGRTTPLKAIDHNGRVKFTLDTPAVNGGFRSGVLAVNLGGGSKIGLIDKSGKLVVPKKFQHVEQTHDGLIEVRADHANGHMSTQVIDTAGNVLYDTDKPAATFNANGIHVFKFGEGAFYTLENDPKPAAWFKNGLAIASGKVESVVTGYIDFTGEFAIPPKYVASHDFCEGLAHVLLPGQPNHHAFIDKTGHTVITLDADITDAGDMHDGMAAFSKSSEEFENQYYLVKKVGFIDKSGKTVIPATYDASGDLPAFSEGLALVVREGTYGFVDKTGKIQIPFGEYAKAFHDGVAVRCAHVDQAGNLLDLNDNRFGYQTLDSFRSAICEALTTKLRTLNPEKHVRFRFRTPQNGKTSEVRVVHSSGSPSIDKELVDAITSLTYPRQGPSVTYGADLEFVLWNHVVTPGHTKDDPFYRELVRQHELSSHYPGGTSIDQLKSFEELVALDELLVDNEDNLYSDSWSLLLKYRDTNNWDAYEKLARKMYNRDVQRGFKQLKEALYRLGKTEDLAALTKEHEDRLRVQQFELDKNSLLDSWLTLGDAYFDKKEYESAEKEYRKCFDASIDCFSRNQDWAVLRKARWRLIFFHLNQKAFAQARTEFATLVQSANAHNESYSIINNPFIQNYLAVIYKHSPQEFNEDVDKVDRSSPPSLNTRWGFIDSRGAAIISGKFSDAGEFHQGLANASMVGLWGFIDKHGEWRIRPEYYAATEFSDGLACVTQSCIEDFPKREYIHVPIKWDKDVDNKIQTTELPLNDEIKCGFIDTSGTFQIPPKCTVMATFSQGFVAAQDPKVDQEVNENPNKKANTIALGVMDKTGKMTMHPRFYSIGHFKSGTAAALVDDGGAGYNPGGCIIFSLDKAHGENVFLPGTIYGDDDYYAHRINPKAESKDFVSPYGYADEQGEFVIPPSFEKAERFSDSLAAVQKNGTWGYIDAMGTMRIDNKFERAFPFENGVARVQQNGKTGLIDKNGKVICAPKYHTIDEFSEGFAVVRDAESSSAEKCNFVDSAGHYLCQSDFDKVHRFSNGLAAVQQNRLWGFIDKSGHFVIAPQYADARDFSDGAAAVLFAPPHNPGR